MVHKSFYLLFECTKMKYEIFAEATAGGQRLVGRHLFFVINPNEFGFLNTNVRILH